MECLETMDVEESIEAGDIGHMMLGGGNANFGKFSRHFLYPGVSFLLNSANTSEHCQQGWKMMKVQGICCRVNNVGGRSDDNTSRLESRWRVSQYRSPMCNS